MLEFARNYPISNLSRHWKQRTEISLSLWLKWPQSLKSREIYEEHVITSFQPVITIKQRKDIRYCIFINMFLRRENIKRSNIFQYFFTCTLNGPFQSSLYLVPRAPTARVRSGFKIKTDSAQFYGVGLDWLLPSSWRKRTCSYFHVYTCATGKVQTSTSSPEASRPHSVSEARIFSSFQLLSIVLTYKLNWLFSFFSACPGLILIREQWKKRETKI